MSDIDWTQSTPIPVTGLPQVISTYLVAHRDRDTDAEIAALSDDAAITDEGHTYVGHDEIRGWLAKTASEYTYTTTLVSASRLDDTRYDAVQRIEGNFPGGIVDLHFRFVLSGDKIASLTIEP